MAVEHVPEQRSPLTAAPDTEPAREPAQTAGELTQTISERAEPLTDRVAASSELDGLRAEVQRLAAENVRYREHAERTSKLFLAATNYAEWIKDNARRDAELALRKTRARVAQFESATRTLEEKEREQARLQGELERLQALVDETRGKLSAFLSAGLEALNSKEVAGLGAPRESDLGDLTDTLHSQLLPASAQALEAPSGATDHGDQP